MTATLTILAITIILFVNGRIRADIVALCALAAMLLLGILTPEEALAGFSSTVVIMMVGLFVVGGAILQTGLAKAASQKIMKLAAGSDIRMFLLVVTVTAVIGAFISNTGTVALMMPIVVSMAAQANMRPGRLLMPLAFASSLGGMLTLIGTPPNLVIQQALTGAGYQPLGFFSFFPVGIICIIIGIIVMMPLTKLFLYKKKGKATGKAGGGKTLDELVDEYQLSNGLRRYMVKEQSGVRNKTVAELNLRGRYGLSIIEIRSESTDRSGLIRNVRQSLAGPDSILSAGDIIYLMGDTAVMDNFAKSNGLKRLDNNNMDFYDIGIAEIVLIPTSRLIGTMLKNSGFRERYDINVLGIKRSGNYIMTGLPEEKLMSGDVLLVQGKWSNISRLDEQETDWVVLGQPEEQARQVTLNYRAPLAAVIMVAMVAMMVFDFIPVAPVTAVIVAGLLMVLCGCFRNVEAAYKTINWESIVLIAAMMPMSVALEKTGTSAMISHSLVSSLGSMSPTVLLAGIYFTTSLLTMFISNTATAVLMAPIAMTSAIEIGASPYPFLFAVTLGASMCFASPFSTPPNALVMHAGEYTFSDYVKVGLPLQIVMGVVMTFVLPLLFPF
ncbi:SLC13 family permease [Xylanibacter rodentium]|jgi:di/tricarboxylate transporter|uniref:SLC13 family permease n=3 Tax=Xylanibacter rodentium TaxID=2736289 RepID=A0ABX2ASH8_9BACT|nr:SLC13 family permease [Xylanibacter rodentium]NPE11751.1 SLC13 family permease [Prevotella sp. PJ1A]NPE13692.1 SLC13 family permease [Xylanibacter rodentium]NPE38948.1 SLC13 family permease [Prevotella sp. PCJ2]